MKKYVLNSWISLVHKSFRCIKIISKIIKAGAYSDFRRTADALIYPPCQVNWRTNFIIFSCHVLVILLCDTSAFTHFYATLRVA